MEKILSQNKRGKTGTGVVLFGIVALALLGFLVYSSVNQSIDSPMSKDQPLGACDSTTTPSLTIDSFDKDNVGTSLTESTNLYREKGKRSWNNFTAGTSFEVSALKTYEIVMGITTTDFTDNAYGQMFEYTVPCEENPSIEREVANDEIETSLTSTFYNADDNAVAETFSAGETQTIELRFKAGTDEYFGNPFFQGNPNVLVLELNSTTMDKPESVAIKGGAELKEVSVPGRQALSSGNNYYAYELPLIGDREVSIEIALNADDSNAPAVDDTAYMYAGNYYINSETGEVEFGVENEEDSAVGTDASDSVTIDVTA